MFQEERGSITSRATSLENRLCSEMLEITKFCSTCSLSLEGGLKIPSETGIHLSEEKEAGAILVLKITYPVLVSALESRYNKVQSKESELS